MQPGTCWSFGASATQKVIPAGRRIPPGTNVIEPSPPSSPSVGVLTLASVRRGADPGDQADVEDRPELERPRGAHRRQGALAIGHPGQRYDDGPIALTPDVGLGDVAQSLHPAIHDLNGFVQDVGIGPLR